MWFGPPIISNSSRKEGISEQFLLRASNQMVPFRCSSDNFDWNYLRDFSRRYFLAVVSRVKVDGFYGLGSYHGLTSLSSSLRVSEKMEPSAVYVWRILAFQTTVVRSCRLPVLDEITVTLHTSIRKDHHWEETNNRNHFF